MGHFNPYFISNQCIICLLILNFIYFLHSGYCVAKSLSFVLMAVASGATNVSGTSLLSTVTQTYIVFTTSKVMSVFSNDISDTD